MSTATTQPPPTTITGFADVFTDDRRRGRVIGSSGEFGVKRLGVDVEGVMSIDNGALRIGVLHRPGWGRSGIAYGPVERTPGLAMAALVLDGHNTSQSYSLSRIYRRIGRWALGAPGTDPVLRRVLRWPLRPGRESAMEHVRRWMASRRSVAVQPPVKDNLAVGWFPSEAPADATAEGNAFIMHAVSHENGELRVRAAGRPMPLSRNVQNLPILYVVVLRERGAAYYAASLPGAHAVGGYPSMRPLGIDAFGSERRLYAGVHQAVLGEIGFSVDTRVYGVRVEPVESMREWYGGAHAADTLTGAGPLEGSDADCGGTWRGVRGSFQRTADGARAIAAGSLALLETEQPCGLVHALVTVGSGSGGGGGAGVAFRVQDPENLWCVTVRPDGAQLRCCTGGVWSTVASSEPGEAGPAIATGRALPLQILDDGRTIQAWLDGAPLFAAAIADERLGGAAGIGLVASAADGGVRFRDLEAHPRSVPIPEELDIGPPWCLLGSEVAAADDFSGEPGDLAGRTTPTGSEAWRRELGRGIIDVTGGSSASGAKVRATVEQPNPGRTAYTIPWKRPEFADIEAVITPPGTERGHAECGRSGVIFWQDANNYIILNLWLDDGFPGASISSFFYLHGHEDIYDAVWTNVGARITWGKPYQFRVVFDGLNYLALVNREPVLYRSLRDVYPTLGRLAIHRVGLCANWEFGDDTGTRFGNFVVRWAGRGSDPTSGDTGTAFKSFVARAAGRRLPGGG